MKATEEITNEWYNQPGGKRRHATTKKEKPLRRSKRSTKEQNARSDKLEEEDIQCEEEIINEEQPNFGSGLKPQHRTTRSNNNQATKRKAFTLSPPSWSLGMIGLFKS